MTTTKFDNIFKAHAKCLEPALIHGSSGFGKSFIVKDFAKRHGFKVLEKRTCYVDPTAVVLPHKDLEHGCVTFMPADWLHELMTTTEPTILFLDEFNRPASSQTFSLFTELLLDRTIDDLRISDSVLILGACNLADEDVGVVEIPNAVMNRLTHIVHAPSVEECCAHLTTELARKVVPGVAQSLLKRPAVPQITPDACNRQVDAVCKLWETGMLDFNDLGVVARGRLGLEKGNILSSEIRKHVEQRKTTQLPSKLTENNMKEVLQIEQDGGKLEVIAWLLAQTESNTALVARYLASAASPEVCRALVEHKFFKDLTVQGETMDWRGFAIKRGALSPKRVAA